MISPRTMLTMAFFSLLISLDANEGFSGTIYYKWLYPTDSTAGEFNNFSFDRIYLKYEKAWGPDMKINLTTDVAAPTQGEGWHAYQKFAYLEYSSAVGQFLIGLQGMNIFNVAEKTWGYRFLAKASMHDRKFSNSADMGLGYVNTFGETLHLHLTLTNGIGYKHVENDQYKKMAVQVVYGPKNLSQSKGFNAGFVGSFEPYTYQGADTLTESRTVIALFGGLATPALRVGGEFDVLTDSGMDLTKWIMAVYIDHLIPVLPDLKMKVFGRVEYYEPDLDLESDRETDFIVGLNFSPAKAFKVAPNLRYHLPEGRTGSITAYQLNFEFKY